MNTLIVSTFPDCGKFNPIKLNSKFVNIYVNRHRKTKEGAANPEFPGNYIDVVNKCVGKFEVVLVSSNPAIRHELCLQHPDKMAVVYLRGDTPSLQSLTDTVQTAGGEKNDHYIQSVTRNWDRWHKEAELFCIEHNIPYFEVNSTEEANALIEKLAKERADTVEVLDDAENMAKMVVENALYFQEKLNELK